MPVATVGGGLAGGWGGLSRAGSKCLGVARRGSIAALYALVFPIMQLMSLVYFRRIAVHGAEHLPRSGPVLLAINHPSTWADVVVLEVALARKLHFITHERLFQPWPRGLVLRFFGSLPISFRHERNDSTRFNRDTFARARGLFGRGEVVAFFPEGVSHSDRTLLPLKTGAARLLLESSATQPHAPTLVPVAIWYEDRTAFRGSVTLAIVPPMDTEAAHAQWTRSPDAAAHALTEAIARSLATALERAEECGVQGETRASAERPASRSAWDRSRLDAMAAPLAWSGRFLHALPISVIESATRRLARQPEQTAFARMLGGLVLFPLWYVCLAALASRLGGGPWLAVPFVTPVLGWLACRDWDQCRIRRAKDAGGKVATRSEKTP